MAAPEENEEAFFRIANKHLLIHHQIGRFVRFIAAIKAGGDILEFRGTRYFPEKMRAGRELRVFRRKYKSVFYILILVA